MYTGTLVKTLALRTLRAVVLLGIQIRSSAVDVVVIDSVAALIPKREIDGEMGDANIALQARLMSQVQSMQPAL